jgi:hypothetical protein
MDCMLAGSLQSIGCIAVQLMSTVALLQSCACCVLPILPVLKGLLCRPASAISSPYLSVPSSAAGNSECEQVACMLCLGRMAVLAARTQDADVQRTVATIVVNVLGLVRSTSAV